MTCRWSTPTSNECPPEEASRHIVDVISDVSLAYYKRARRCLRDTGCAPGRIYVTGSPMAEVLRATPAFSTIPPQSPREVVRTVVELDGEGSLPEAPVHDYADDILSTKVVKIIRS